MSNGWVSSQRSCCSVDATFKRTEWTCRALRMPVSVEVRLEGASKTGDVRLFRDDQVSCKSCPTREEVGTEHLVGQERAGLSDKEI